MTTGQRSPAVIDGRPDRLRTVRHRGAFGIAIVLAGLAVAVTAPPRGSQAAAASARRSAGAVTALPALFDQWDVELGQRRGEEGALTLAYTSPALGRRTENTVYLPNSYSSDGPPLPVLYFLHGTVAPLLDNPALDPATSQEFLLDMIASGGGDIQTRLQNFAAQRHHAHFVVVALDTARAGNWCQTCVWINGIKPTIQGQPPFSARTVPAETILETEVRPLVEHLLNVRSDRGGRGISGFSMGAVGALIQALRHPDEYAYVAAISGPINFVDDPFWRTWVDFVGYLHDQGYGYSATDAERWRTINPSDLIRNLAGAGTPVTITAGDGCIGPADEVGRRDCDRYPALRNPFAASIETQMRRNNDTYAAAVAAGGVNADQLRFPGVHGANNPRVYADVIVPAANDAFARARPVAETFSYRNGDPTFSVWGYTVDTHRTGSAVFTTLDARHDGAAFAVTGTGSLEVTTPPTFRPGRPYSVRTGGSALMPRIVQADADGRIRLDRLLLPPPGSAPGRIAITITPA